jgi:hypothetical protein
MDRSGCERVGVVDQLGVHLLERVSLSTPGQRRDGDHGSSQDTVPDGSHHLALKLEGTHG